MAICFEGRKFMPPARLCLFRLAPVRHGMEIASMADSDEGTTAPRAMTPTRKAIAGIAVALAFFVALEFAPYGDFVFMILGALSLFIVAVRKTHLPLMLRVFITTCIFYWGFSACITGRTMQPGLTRFTAGMALSYFGFLGLWPGIALFKLWHRRIAIGLLCALLPVSFALAVALAGTEEYLFVRKYRDTGVGPTARWTVSMHWLAYDRETRRLGGSD